MSTECIHGASYRLQEPCEYCAEDEHLKSELLSLRAALIQSGRAVGALLTDDVSSEFLTHVPAEVEAVMVLLKARESLLDQWNEKLDSLRSQEQEILKTLRMFDAKATECGPDALLKIRLGIDDLSRDHEAELAALRAAREQDLRPVSDEEWPQKQLEHFSFPKYGPARSLTRQDVDALLAARRAAAGEKKGKIESS